MFEFGENKGDIWQIFYYAKRKLEFSENMKQNFIDSQTREMGRGFDPPPGLSPEEYSSLFMNHFLKSREKSRDMLNTQSEVRERYSENFQVGNLECIDQIRKIESSQDFHSWENPSLVSYFKMISETYL